MKGFETQKIPNMDTSCLIYACINGLDAVAEILLHRPATNMNQMDVFGWCPMTAAYASKSARCVEILKRAGADPVGEYATIPPPPPTKLGRFIWTLVYRHWYYHAELFIRHSKDPNRARYVPKDDETTLFYAVIYGAYSLCSVLLTNGANVNRPARNGITLLEVAFCAYARASEEKPDLMEDYRQTILVLLSHGARFPRSPVKHLPDFCVSFARRQAFYGSSSMAALSLRLKPRPAHLEITPALSRRACPDLQCRCGCGKGH